MIRNFNLKLLENQTFTTFLIVFVVGGLGLFLATQNFVDLPQVVTTFQWGILGICVAMDLFTNLVVATGIMEAIAVRMAWWSQGQPRAILYLFALLLFLVSSPLNNVTAVLVVLPIILILLRSLDLSQAFVGSFFSLLLAISNLGGAATPIGDFPAIIIMKSGITDFSNYFIRAFPLCATTAVVLTLVHVFWFGGRQSLSTKKPSQPSEQTIIERKTAVNLLERKIAVKLLGVRYKHLKVRWQNLLLLSGVFVLMCLAWAMLPADHYPPELIAITGLSIAGIFLIIGQARLRLEYDLTPIVAIGAFLLLAAVVSNSGILVKIANGLQDHISNATLLLLAVMVLTTLLSGLFSAGPTAAAMMPVILSLGEGTFQGQQDWLAIAFAASICAGSSLFLSSATAGFVLSAKIEDALLQDSQGRQMFWNFGTYFKYGFVHAGIQLAIAVIWILCFGGVV